MSAKWMRVETDFVDHPKVLRLAARLAASEADAGWYVMRAWSWVSRFCPTGQVRDIDGTALESACRWSGERGELLSALVSTGWFEVWDIDGTRAGIEVHDWPDHQGRVAAKASKERERKRAYRAKKATEEAANVPRDNDGTSGGTNTGRPAQRDVTGRDVTGRDVEIAGSPPAHGAVVAKPPKKPKPDKPTDPRHASLVAALVQIFAEVRGADYGFSGRDAKAVADLLALGEPDVVAARWRRALAHMGFPTVARLAELVTHWNHFAGQRVADNRSPVAAESVDWSQVTPGEVQL